MKNANQKFQKFTTQVKNSQVISTKEKNKIKGGIVIENDVVMFIIDADIIDG